MRLRSIKPTSGFSHFFHILLLLILPALVFVFVRLGFVEIATALILMSKWRMLAVKPRHWPANIRANSVDIMVGISLLIFMLNSGSLGFQFFWAVSYSVWLIFIKPKSSQFAVAMQALIAQTFGLSAVFLQWGSSSSLMLVILGWLVCYLAARHFFSIFEEPLNVFFASIWGYFAASAIWVLSHWLIFYGFVAQTTLVLSVIAFSLSSIYYLDRTDRLSSLMRRQLVFIMVVVILIIFIGLTRQGYVLKSQQ